MKKLLIFIIVIGIIFGGLYIFLFREPQSEDQSALYNDIRLIHEGDLQPENYGTVVQNQVYLSLDYVKEKIDNTIAYDEGEKTVIITNDKAVRRYKVGEMTGTSNDVNVDLRAPITEMNGKIMLPIEAFIYDYNIDVKYNAEDNLILVDRKDTEYITGKITANESILRESSNSNSPIIKTLSKDAEVIVYGESDNWYKVREKEGKAGYVKKKDVEVSYKFESFTKLKEKEEVAIEKKEKINLVWDYTSVRTQNADGVEKLVGVNVISPTWFSLMEDYSIQDRSNRDYVDKAHSYGMKVWGMFDNSFKAKLTEEALAKSSNRQKIIADVFRLAKNANLDGINVDFENINIHTRDNFTQFMRELYPIFKEAGMTVSVDVIPRIFSEVEKEPYDRAALAKTVDYVMLMAYDQHWSTSPKAGSVAEYKWVESNMNVLFRSIPMEKFVLGMPLYTRIWFDNGDKVTSQSVSMEVAKQYIATNGMEVEWDDQAKQNVAKKQIGDSFVSIWLEDSDSIKAKTTLATKYGLAGVASWRKGFETPDIWATIAKNLD